MIGLVGNCNCTGFIVMLLYTRYHIMVFFLKKKIIFSLKGTVENIVLEVFYRAPRIFFVLLLILF